MTQIQATTFTSRQNRESYVYRDSLVLDYGNLHLPSPSKNLREKRVGRLPRRNLRELIATTDLTRFVSLLPTDLLT